MSASLLVGLRARDPDPDAVGGGGEVLDRQGDELGAPKPDAQFAEVGVDIDTGEIRLTRMLGVFSAGRISTPTQHDRS